MEKVGSERSVSSHAKLPAIIKVKANEIKYK